MGTHDFKCKNIFYILYLILVVVDLTMSVRHNYCMDSNIPFIHCSKKTTVVNVNVNITCL